MKQFLFLMVCSLVVTGPTFSYAAKGNAEKGKQYYASCQTCHGEHGQGNKEANAPRLAGQRHWYLARQLQNFENGIRGTHENDTLGQQMRSMALMLLVDAQALKDVVAYIATLEAEAPARTEQTGVPDKGKIIFASCQSCHGESGQGNETLGGPRLAGQHDWYLMRQLQNFRAGIRGAHEKDTYGQTMASMAHALLPNEQAIKDVVAYIKTLQ